MLVFVIVPLIELAVILQIGQVIGPWWTILLLVVFSIVGAMLLRHEGRRAWRAFRAALQEGRWPGDEVTQGALVLVGGTLLLTPGFVTDGVGFLLLVPVTRAGVARLIRARVTPRSVGAYRTVRRRPRRRRGAADAPGRTLDVEVVDVEREEPAPPASSEPRHEEPSLGERPGEGTDHAGPNDADGQGPGSDDDPGGESGPR